MSDAKWRIYACWKDLQTLGRFHLCPQPPQPLPVKRLGAGGSFVCELWTPAAPLPMLTESPVAVQEKNLEIEVPTSAMMRNTIVATPCADLDSPAAVPSAAASSNKRLIQHSQISATGSEVIASSIVGYEWKTISHPFDSDIHPFNINHNSWTPKTHGPRGMN